MNKYEGFVGKVLDGRYKILELVGLGGMACVLKAQDLVMNRIVAIKILNDEYNGNESAEARFIDESKAVAMLSNKNIVGVYDVAIYPDIKYIVMEYLDGITLREYLDNKGVLQWKEACIYILQILRALEHAHSKGIIHRDIKPQNVMLMKNGDIKVTDFGIAKLPDSVTEQKDEKAVGTVYYISPEQACGKKTDYYSDIYSVGIMFYEAVTGTLPFTADTPMEIAMMQVNDEAVHPRDIVLDIPVGVSQIILKAMEKSPEERFQSAHAMVKAIEWVLRYPDVIFAMNSSGADENPAGNSSFVSIDMISTAELEPYGDEEIGDTLGKGVKNDKNPVENKPKTRKKGKKTVKKKRKRSTSMFPIICGVSFSFILVAVILLVTVGASALNAFLNPAEDPEAIYPDLTKDGVYYSEELVNNLLTGTGYGAKFVIDEVIFDSHDDIENNKILSTEPKGGHQSKPGADGKLHFTQITVNRTEKVIIPNLDGFPKTTAEITLKNLGLNVEFVEDPAPENPFYNANQVISVSPVFGTEVKVGDTVTVTICKRNNSGYTAKMPNVVGMTQSEATKHAQTYAQYMVVVEEVPSADGDNRVFEQSISEGTVSPIGTTVTIRIAVPLKTFFMPNLIGMKYVDATEAMNTASPDVKVNVVHHFYAINEEVREYFEPEAKTKADMNSLLNLMRAFEATKLTAYDGIGTVFFQSVAFNTECSKDIQQIDVIYITYTSAGIIPEDTTSNSTVSSEETVGAP